MTEQPLQPIDPGTIHPALRDALLIREPLMWAFDNDGQMREQVRQLDVVLHALAKHMPDRWLADRLLADPTILPTDEALVQRRYEQERRLRELTMRLTGVPDVHLDDAEQVQCMKLGDPEHRGTHPQLSSCILPLAPSPGGWAQ